MTRLATQSLPVAPRPAAEDPLAPGTRGVSERARSQPPAGRAPAPRQGAGR